MIILIWIKKQAYNSKVNNWNNIGFDRKAVRNQCFDFKLSTLMLSGSTSKSAVGHALMTTSHHC